MLTRYASAPGLDATGSPFALSGGNPYNQVARATYCRDEEAEEGETLHQRLQGSLGVRAKGGPMEQVRSIAHRLRGTRSTDILHSSISEPLASYKKLVPLQPRLKSTNRRYHLTDGYTVFDHDTIVVEARDQLVKTKNGLLRTSTGTVTYSATHRQKLDLDVQELIRILAHERWPGGGHGWTLKKLERLFKERAGRQGVWAHYEVPFDSFMELFPKTFMFYGNREFVQLVKNNMCTCLDDTEAAMVRLAKAREVGHISTLHAVNGSNHQMAQPNFLPELTQNRMKAAFTSRYGSAPEDSVDELERQHELEVIHTDRTNR